ncbi:MAG: hypothetical protein Q8K82_11365 [Gemmatimonadaceae bacterium]|nr:hypothetical protein [Gemmatimonadaceae bacterium]
MLTPWPSSTGEVLDTALTIWRRHGLMLTLAGAPLMLAATMLDLASEFFIRDSDLCDSVVDLGLLIPFALAEELVALRVAELIGVLPHRRADGVCCALAHSRW